MSKFLYPNKCGTITMTNENASFPAEYMLTDYIKQKAKSTTNTSTVVVSVIRAGGMAIFGTNAYLVEVSAGRGIDIAWDTGIDWDTGIEWEQTADYYSVGSFNPQANDFRGDGNGKIYIDYTDPDPHDVTLEFTCSEVNELEIGLIFAGPLYEYSGPLLGMTQDVIDYSIVRELNSPGSMYIEDKDQVGVWQFEFVEDYASDFYEFLYAVVGRAQLNPFPCWFVEDNYYHFAFCRLDNRRMPTAFYGDMINHGIFNVRFIEVV